MNPIRGLVTVALALPILFPAAARADDSLACSRSELKDSGCTTVAVNHSPLLFTASCEACSGSGANIHCASEQQATAGSLGVEDAATGASVAGAVAWVKTCDIGMPLWRFDGALVNGTAYQVVVKVPGFAKVVLLRFTAGKAGPLPDQDAGPSPRDGAMPGGGDGGCGCQVGAQPATLAGFPLAAVLLLLWARTRRR